MYKLRFSAVVLCLLSSLACDMFEQANDDRLDNAKSELEENMRKWGTHGLKDYQYVLQYTCCGPQARYPTIPTSIIVRSGVVDTVKFPDWQPLEQKVYTPEELKDEESNLPLPYWSWMWEYPTIVDLFDLMQQQIDRMPYEFEAEYDPVYGYPTKVWIDVREDCFDEEDAFIAHSLASADSEPWHPIMEVVATSIYGEVPSNASIVVFFSIGGFDFLDISVSEATGVIRIDEGDRVIWTPTEDMSLGVHTLTVDASRWNCELEYFEPLIFEVVGPDNTSPEIIDAECDPENGATGVNPADYTEEFTITFSERMLEVGVVSASLDVYSFESTRPRDYNPITIILPGNNRLPYDTKFRATLSGIDYSGNELATTEYSFVTMKKPQ